MTKVEILRDYFEKHLAMKPMKAGDSFTYADDARAKELELKGYVKIIPDKKSKAE